MPTFSNRCGTYARLWDTLIVKTNRREVAARQVERLKRPVFRAQYELVSMVTGVPWYVIGLFHMLESSADFTTHLHNGDPLTARTVQEPKGHPKVGDPPFSWSESACDALEIKKLGDVVRWTIERIAYESERYNGWGYVRTPIYSPYLWAGSTHYEKGKYISDGKYDPNAVSNQIGTMVLLRLLMDSTNEIRPEREPEPDATPMV